MPTDVDELLGTGIVIVVLAVAAIWSFLAYRRAARQRQEALVGAEEVRRRLDEARREITQARRDLLQARRELEEARRHREALLAELEAARRHWQDAIRRLIPKIEIHTAGRSELMEILRGAREDRRRLAELISGYRKVADKGLRVLRRLGERSRTRDADPG